MCKFHALFQNYKISICLLSSQGRAPVCANTQNQGPPFIAYYLHLASSTRYKGRKLRYNDTDIQNWFI